MKNVTFFHSAFILLLASFTSTLSFTLQANEPQKVSTAQAKELFFYPQKNATAVAKALNHTNVPSQIPAQVNSIAVQRGESVSKGQLLVELDCQNNELSLAYASSVWSTAKVQLSLSQRNLQRAMRLHKNKNIGEAELDNSQVAVEVATLKVAELNVNVKTNKLAVQRCNIYSPYDGIITKRLVSEGDYVATGQTLLSVVQKNSIEIQAQVPVSQLNDLVNGQRYQFINNDISVDITLKNVVEFIETNSQSQIVSFSVAHDSVISGAEGMINWHSPVTFLPAHLLTQRKNQYGIFIVNNKKAKFITVDSAQEGRPFKLSLDDSSQIIIDGRHRVSDGEAVSFVAE
ncbi:MAG: efflux RND transporter periplasmic adaptor subunit [Colwellia sp.]|nr:efflux RND transporter periplasmic adaptor subunit [Colwellia sp.]